MIWKQQHDHILIFMMLPRFIAQKRQNTKPASFTTTATTDNLMGRQLDVYTTVKQHFESSSQEPVHIIINGTVGTGKILCYQLFEVIVWWLSQGCSTNWSSSSYY